MNLLKTALTVALLAVAGASMAQPTQPSHSGAMNHAPGARIVKLLNLDATRAVQVTSIMTDSQAQRHAVFESMKGKRDDPAAREAAHAKMKALGDATKARLATVLTPAEMATLKQARHHHGHGAKQG